MSNPLRPLPPDDVVWEGRPTVGVQRGDALVGALALGLCLVVLGGGLHWGYGVALERALQVAALYGAFVAAVVTFARAVGASVRAHGSLGAFLGALAMASLTRDERLSLAVVCSFSAASLVGLVLLWRMRQRLRTRYRLTRERGAMGEEGRYTVTFRFQSPPRVIPDRFGKLADVELTVSDAQLITRGGKVFRMPTKVYRMHRVRDSKALLSALGG